MAAVLGAGALSLLGKPATWGVIGFLALGAFAGVQTLRLNNAKHDEAIAKAAQIDPATKKPWMAEYVAEAAQLASCKGSVSNLEAGIDDQNASIAAKAAKDAAALAQSEAAVRAARASAAASAAQVARLSAAITGATPADRCAAFDQTFLSTLQGSPAK